MQKTILSTLLFASAVLLPAARGGAQQLTETMPRMKTTTETPVSLSKLEIDIHVAGGIAYTTYDMLFRNPNSRMLEGNLEIPLSDGESVIGYQLEVNGAMRSGVVVDKAKAREVFEQIVNRNVDPGLIEKTTGNNYRIRIYPIPAEGYKRVTVTTQQALRRTTDHGYIYTMPLTGPDKLDNFCLKANVYKQALKPEVVSGPGRNFVFDRQGDVYQAVFESRNYRLEKPLSFILPEAAEQYTVFTEPGDEGHWFYATFPEVIIPASAAATVAKENVTIWWDVSLSGLRRDLDKEYELLAGYLGALSKAAVRIVAFADAVRDDKSFNLTGGSSAEVINYLKTLTYDGKSDMRVLESTPAARTGKILLFSDGKSSLGEKVRKLSQPATIYAVISGASNDYTALNTLSSGNTINLSNCSVAEAVEKLKGKALKLLKYALIRGSAEDMYPQEGTVIDGASAIYGKISSADALIELSFGVDGEVVATRRITITPRTGGMPFVSDWDYSPIARLWAQQRIAALSGNAERHRSEITALGVKHGVVTDYTSLLVLETIEDYVQYEITPPTELQDGRYRELLRQHNLSKQRNPMEKPANPVTLESQVISEGIELYYNELQLWWKTDFPDVWPKKSKESDKDIISTDDDIMFEAVEMPLFADAEEIEEDVMFMVVEDSRADYRLSVQADMLSSDEALEEIVVPSGYQVVRNRARQEAPVNTIALTPWQSDADYVNELSKVANEEIYARYLQLREEHFDAPAFYADAADMLLKKGQKEHALRVLSNIVEITGQNSEMVKTYGQKLIEYGEFAEAIPAFEYGVQLREEQPQSYRDLAIAYELAGRYQPALETYHKIISSEWNRFDEIKSIVYAEINTLISRHKKQLDLSAVDKRIIFDMPVNTRIVMSWGTDNCDIDLHITEPTGETAYYAHNRTANGGWVSFDFTDGFGPESYMIKKRWKGEYIIKIHYYGNRSQSMLMPVTVYADIFTDYGTAEQKRERITFRLNDQSEMVEVGRITVK